MASDSVSTSSRAGYAPRDSNTDSINGTAPTSQTQSDDKIDPDLLELLQKILQLISGKSGQTSNAPASH